MMNHVRVTNGCILHVFAPLLLKSHNSELQGQEEASHT